MSDRDVLDKKLLAQFLWRAPSDIVDVSDFDVRSGETKAAAPEALAREREETAKPEADEGDGDQKRRDDDRDHASTVEACDALARDVQRAWPLGPGRHDVKIARVANELGLSLIVLNRDHPRETVRLARIIVRSWTAVEKACGTDIADALTWLQLEHPEVVELICEAVKINSGSLAFGIGQCAVTEENGARFPQIGPRLAAIVDDEAQPWDVRARAANWVAVANTREVVPAMRRALRTPSVPLRMHALYVLLGTLRPDELADDVQFVLDDSVEHPIPQLLGSEGEAAWHFGVQVQNAVAKAKPPNGYVPLEAILRGDCQYTGGDRAVLADDAALEALAAGYPERAVPWIDRWLASVSRLKIDHAVHAASHLPDALARPRLKQGAHASWGLTVDQARKVWSERFHAECPMEPDAGIAPAPRSDKFASRLAVLRGPSRDAVVAMGGVLLGEAPDPEALALLAYGVRTDTFGYQSSSVVPNNPQKWIETLIEKFGDAGFEACAAIVEPSARTGGNVDVVHAFAKCARESGSPVWIARARAIVDLALRAPFESRSYSVIRALGFVGPREEEVDMLWDIACPQGEPDRHKFGLASTYDARDVLRMDAIGAAVDARVKREMELWKHDLKRLEAVLAVGVARGEPGAVACATEWSRRAWSDDDARELSKACMEMLRSARRLDLEWVYATAEQDDSPLLRNVLSTLPFLGDPARTEGPLRRACASEDPEAVLLGAGGLMRMDRMEVVAPERLDACLARAHGELAATFLFLHYWKTKGFAPFEAHVSRLLTSDKVTAMAMVHTLSFCSGDEIEELLKGYAPGALADDVRKEMELNAGLPGPHDTYWKHVGEEEEGAESRSHGTTEGLDEEEGREGN